MGNVVEFQTTSLTVPYCFVCIYYITADLYLSCFCRNFFAACRNGLHSYHDGPSQPPAIVSFPAAHMDV